MECGYRFRTVAAAQKAAFGNDGCPKCGGADIDLAEAAKGPCVSCLATNARPS